MTPDLFIARIGRVTFNALPGGSPRVAPHFAAGRARGWLYMARGITARRPAAS